MYQYYIECQVLAKELILNDLRTMRSLKDMNYYACIACNIYEAPNECVFSLTNWLNNNLDNIVGEANDEIS